MGRHLLLEVYGVEFNLLNEELPLINVITRAIIRANMTILNIYCHKFNPQGLTIVIALSESHFSCHTWPEKGTIAVDAYTCGEGQPELIIEDLLNYFKSKQYNIREISR